MAENLDDVEVSTASIVLEQDDDQGRRLASEILRFSYFISVHSCI